MLTNSPQKLAGMERLMSWAQQHGATFEAVTRAEHPRKLFAAKNLQPGDVIFSIPERLLLYGTRAYEDLEYGKAFRQLQDETGALLDPRSLLVLLLVVEKCRGAASFFSPYCDILPSTYDDPFWWSEEELQLLRGTRLLKAVTHYTAGLQQLHSWVIRLEVIHQEHLQQQGKPNVGGCLSVCQNGWGLTLAAVKWARSAVWSRAFTIKDLMTQHRFPCSSTYPNSSGERTKDQGCGADSAAGHLQQTPGAECLPSAPFTDGSSQGPVIALVPVLDMCDHHPDQRVSWRTVTGHSQPLPLLPPLQKQQTQDHVGSAHATTAKQAFQFTSLSPVQQGAELFNNYGTNKPNEELLLGFGFVLDSNPNDSFLVSISHPQQLEAVAAGEGDAEAACHQEADWQRRLAAMAAAGLQLDVPLTAVEPIPPKLLDVMLLAATLPAWAISGISSSTQLSQGGGITVRVQESGPGPDKLGTAGSSDAQVAASPHGYSALAEGVNAAEQQQQQHHNHHHQQSLFVQAALQYQLQGLLLLKQQLTTKLQGMLPQQQLLPLLQPVESIDTCGLTPRTATSSLHARMAAVYVLSQQQLLQAALRAVSQQASECLQQTQSAVRNVSHQQLLSPLKPSPALTASGAAIAEPGVARAQAKMRLHDQLSLCGCCGGFAVATEEGIPSGSLLLQTSMSCCISGCTADELVRQLMWAAAYTTQQQQQEQQQQQQQSKAEQELLQKQQQQQTTKQVQQGEEGGSYATNNSMQSCPAYSYFAQHWQQQQMSGPAHAACRMCYQILPWWLLPGYEDLVGVLQGTPAGDHLLQASEEHQANFQAFFSSLKHSAAAVDSSSSTGNGTSHTSNALQQQQQDLLHFIQQAQPQNLLRLFCWAERLVQQAAISLCQQDGTSLLVLLPGLEGVPKVVRELLMECRTETAVDTASQRHRSSKPDSGVTDSILHVISTARLPACCQISRASVLSGSNAQQLLLEEGPAVVLVAAAADDLRDCEWFQPAADAAPANTAAMQAAEALHPATSRGSAALTTQNSSWNAVDASQQRVERECSVESSTALGHGLHHVYEVVLSPSEHDALAGSKLLLLSRSGLGLCHYLTEQGATKQSNSSSAHQQQIARLSCKSAVTDQHEGQQSALQQQQQAEGVLVAMAVCLLSDDEAAHMQLLSQETLDAILHEQPSLRHAAGGLPLAAAGLQGELATGTRPCGAQFSQALVGGATTGHACSSTPALPANPYAESVCNTSAGADGGNGSSRRGELQDGMVPVGALLEGSCVTAGLPAESGRQGWSSTQQLILQQTGRKAQKQLVQVLKEDKKSFKTAHRQILKMLQGLQQQEEEVEEGDKAAAGGGGSTRGDTHALCDTCCRKRQAVGTNPLMYAACGFDVYLRGQQRTLDAWLALLQSSDRAGKAAVGGSSKSKKGAPEEGTKTRKKSKH